ncbi:polysaccharide biosynthesis/export family protein [Candidatus Poribacteria bacterium]|nr:polysaccharide biosynthesis/export family protein [Candidatus Poribacteria bacterium]
MTRRLLILIGLLMVGLITGCTAFHGAGTVSDYPVVREETYHLQAPDEIEISVLPQEELNRGVTIRPDGKISLPLIGDVFVEGMTPMEVSSKLTEEFSKYVKNPVVAVIVTGFHSKKVYVIGEVERQGVYPYTGEMTAFEAVEEAGSFTRRAALGRVILVRGDLKNPKVIDVDLKRVVKEGMKQNDLFLQPDDIVYIPPNGFAKAGYAIEQVLFPFMPILGVGSSLTSVRSLEETF